MSTLLTWPGWRVFPRQSSIHQFYYPPLVAWDLGSLNMLHFFRGCINYQPHHRVALCYICDFQHFTPPSTLPAHSKLIIITATSESFMCHATPIPLLMKSYISLPLWVSIVPLLSASRNYSMALCHLHLSDPVATLQRQLWSDVCTKFHENSGILTPLLHIHYLWLFFT